MPYAVLISNVHSSFCYKTLICTSTEKRMKAQLILLAFCTGLFSPMVLSLRDLPLLLFWTGWWNVVSVCLSSLLRERRVQPVDCHMICGFGAFVSLWISVFLKKIWEFREQRVEMGLRIPKFVWTIIGLQRTRGKGIFPVEWCCSV